MVWESGDGQQMWTPQRAAACALGNMVQLLGSGQQQGQLFCPLVEACARLGILGVSHLAWGMRGILGKEGGEQGALQLEQSPASLHDSLLSPIMVTSSGEKGLRCCRGQLG